MKDPQYQAIWHALNEANVSLVLASRELVPKRREMLVAALEQSRKATLLLLDVLSEREVNAEELKS